MRLEFVPANYVYSVWGTVSPMIQAALDAGAISYSTIDQVKGLLTQNAQQLLIVLSDEVIVGAVVVEFVNYPNERAVYIVEVGGKGIMTEDLCDQFENWARQNGATVMCAWADESRARLYKMKAKFSTARYVLEKKL